MLMVFSFSMMISCTAEKEEVVEAQVSEIKATNVVKSASPESLPENEVIEGLVLEVSAYPDPKTADYKNCLYSCLIKVTSLPEEPEVAVYFWAFKNRKLTETSRFYPKLNLRFKLHSMESSVEYKTSRRADNLTRFDVPIFAGEFISAVIDKNHFHRSSKFTRLEAPVDRIDEQIRMLVHMSESMKKKGISFLIVPYPFKEEIVDAKEVRPGSKAFLGTRGKLLRKLRAKKLNVLDLATAFKNDSHSESLFYAWDYDHHPTDEGLHLAAQTISTAVTEKLNYLPSTRILFETKKVQLSDTKNLQIGDKTQYFATQIFQDGTVIDLWNPSEVVVLGDSITRVPLSSYYGSIEGASLPAQLSNVLGVRCSSFTVSGGAPSMPRLLHRHPEVLNNAKVCVFVFAAYYAWRDEPGMWNIVDF